MPSVSQPDMGDAAAKDSHHHRLDNCQSEEGSDSGIDCVATGREHLSAGRRGDRMIGDHHAACGSDRLLFAAECRTRATAPVSLRHAEILSCDIAPPPCAGTRGGTIRGGVRVDSYTM